MDDPAIPPDELVPLAAIRQAAERLGPSVRCTPLLPSPALEARTGTAVWLKCESLQVTGSFKARGALNHLLLLDPSVRERGVVTISAGNHALALSWAAAAAEVPATVVMPASASPAKARACADQGAEVVMHGSVHEAFQKARDLERERGLHFVHPFDDPDVVAGQGTVGLEVLDQLPDAATVVVPVGGGGLVAGVAAAVRRLRPGCGVWGVEPEGANAMARSLEEGRAVHLERVDTVADGLAPPMAGEIPFAHVRALVEGIVTVSDEEILDAVCRLADGSHLVVEPAGAAGVAALLSGRIPLEGPVVVVVSGGNVDPRRLAEFLGRST